MLQCSRCAGPVSAFAARCPGCGHSVADADPYFCPLDGAPPAAAGIEQVGAAPAAAGPIPSRPFRRLRRPVVLAVAVTTAAAVTAGGIRAASDGSGRTGPLAALYGRVVAVGRAATLTSYEPATGRTARYALAGAPAGFVPVALSSDRASWLGSDGTVVGRAESGQTFAAGSVAAAVSSTTSPARPGPFSDRGAAVVLLSRPTAAWPAMASVLDISHRTRYELGMVDHAAGDPQAIGAFVSTPARPDGPSANPTAVPDVDVELRAPSRPPDVLATAAHLNEDVGWLGSRPVRLGVYPSPTGDVVAVVLTPLLPVGGDTPMVVLDRTGGLVAAVDDWHGPMYGVIPVWSPGGHQLAYPTYTTTGPALAIGSETGAFGTVAAPPGTTFGPCLWSLSSTQVVCQARVGGRDRWLWGLPTAGRLLSTASAGTPVAWVASPLPRPGLRPTRRWAPVS